MKPYYDDGRGIVIYHARWQDVPLARVDLLLTDPPYGLKADNQKRILSRRKLAAPTDYGETNWDSETPKTEDINTLVSLAQNSIIWGGNYFWLPPSPAWLVWDKLNSGDFADAELAWSNLKQAVRLFKFMWNGMLRDGEMRGKKRSHPTQKPLELMTWCLSFAPDSKTVLDPFMGSGTTLRAAKDLGRKATGIEIEERYCEIAAKRLQQEVLTL